MWSGFLDFITAHGSTVTIGVFVVGQMLSLAISTWRRMRHVKVTTTGLYHEISENVFYLQDLQSPEALLEKRKMMASASADRNYRPLIIINESSKFYDAVVKDTPALKRSVLIALADHHKLIRDEYALSTALNGAAYPTISLEARAALIDELWSVFEKAEKSGIRAQQHLRDAYRLTNFAAIEANLSVLRNEDSTTEAALLKAGQPLTSRHQAFTIVPILIIGGLLVGSLLKRTPKHGA